MFFIFSHCGIMQTEFSAEKAAAVVTQRTWGTVVAGGKLGTRDEITVGSTLISAHKERIAVLSPKNSVSLVMLTGHNQNEARKLYCSVNLRKTHTSDLRKEAVDHPQDQSSKGPLGEQRGLHRQHRTARISTVDINCFSRFK